MKDSNGEELMTQSEAAALRGMTLAAVNQHVRRGLWRSAVKYGKRLVYRADVVGFNPKTHKLKHAGKGSARRKAASKPSASKTGKQTRRTKGGKPTARPRTSGPGA